MFQLINNIEILAILYGKLVRLLSYDNSINNSITLYGDIGNELVNLYFYKLYKKELKYEYMSDWRYENKDIIIKFKDNTFIHNLGSIVTDWLKQENLIVDKLEKSLIKQEKVYTIYPSEELLNKLEDKPLLPLPYKLPMLVKPKPYYISNDNQNIERVGGYLLNDSKSYNELIISKWNLETQSTICENNIIYDSVNKLASVGYKINKDVLNFVQSNVLKYDKYIPHSYIHPLIKKFNKDGKLYKFEKKELNSFLSKKYIQDNIIGIANIYENIHEFFIPLRIDYRGRIYCVNEYLNYQSTELAKALLLFSKGEEISKSDRVSINYLKLYGANCFGLNKLSFDERIKWVDDNEDKIQNFKDFYLISKAESKYLFTAFCFEYNRYLNNLENDQSFYFETFLPIQLDASCNGYQHLSMLSLDLELAKHLNLTKSNNSDIPNDFYSFITKLIKDYIKKILETSKIKDEKYMASLKRLSVLDMQRKLVKKTIMTIPYNASKYKIVEQLKESFSINQELSKFKKELDKDEDNINDIWYKSNESDINLKNEDFSLFCNIIFHVLNQHFSNLEILVDYFKQVSNILSQLQLHIPWVLPSGININQGYLNTKDSRIKPFSYSKKTFVLKKVLTRDEVSKCKTIKSVFNDSKQIRSFMPNLIHSLDACALTMLVNEFFKLSNNIKNIYSIHDCFAVNCNNVVNIINLLKVAYISIYGNHNYLINLDEAIKNYISITIGRDFNKETLQVRIFKNDKEKFLQYPNLSDILEKNNRFRINEIKESFYIIN